MPTREQMIADLRAEKKPSREQMIAELRGDSPAPQEEPGMLDGLKQSALGAIGAVGNTVDRFTGAPVRSAIGAVQNKENPISAYMNQFGEDPEQAPTGKEIAQKAGVTDRNFSSFIPAAYGDTARGLLKGAVSITPAAPLFNLPGAPLGGAVDELKQGGALDPTVSGAAGLGVDIAADPLNIVGAGEVLGAAKKAGGLLARGAGRGIEGAAKVADAVTGMKAATSTVDAVKSAANTTGKIAEAGKKSISSLLKPSLADDAKAMEAIAEKHGIPKELISPAHEFGPNSTITRQQRTIGEGALGQKYLDNHNLGMSKTSEALEKNILGKFGEAPASHADAGSILKDAVDNHVSSVFGDADITYKSAGKQFPGLTINKDAMSSLQSKAVGMRREAQKILRTSADPSQLSQAKNLEAWSNLILNSKGTYKEMSEIVQNVGKAAYGKTPIGQIPSDVKKLRELYDTGSESLIHSIRKVDQNAADRLIVNNQEIREMLGDKSMLGKVVSEAKNPEAVFTSLVERGGSKQIETLKKILPPETFNQMRSRYLQGMVKYVKDTPIIDFAGTRKMMEKNTERLGYLFKPEELQDATEIMKFGERYGSPVMSSSGTGASSGFKGFLSNLAGAAQDEHALEFMKNKARGAANAPPENVVNLPSQGRGLLRNRGGVERRLKAAQSIAPSGYLRPKLSGKQEDENL